MPLNQLLTTLDTGFICEPSPAGGSLDFESLGGGGGRADMEV